MTRIIMSGKKKGGSRKLGLNKSKGNMYSFVSHTWNAIKGICPHDCSYCYMKRWGNLKATRLDEKELRADIYKDAPETDGNFIFVGSGCDMFAEGIPDEWINRTIEHCIQHERNRYLFQSKNPIRMHWKLLDLGDAIDAVVCTTVETNRWYPAHMGNTPTPQERLLALASIPRDRYVTIEPIMDFDIKELVTILRICEPKQVNIGADTGRNGLPEPDKGKVLELVAELKKFTTIENKTNLKRILMV